MIEMVGSEGSSTGFRTGYVLLYRRLPTERVFGDSPSLSFNLDESIPLILLHHQYYQYVSLQMFGLKNSQSSKESENEKKDRNRPSISLPGHSGYLLASDRNRSSKAPSPSSGGFVTPMNGLSLASHTVPLGGISPVWKYLRIYRAMHRLGELNMQWPSESDAKTTEPGQREAMVWALVLWPVSAGMVVWRRGFGEVYFRIGVTGS